MLLKHGKVVMENAIKVQDIRIQGDKIVAVQDTLSPKKNEKILDLTEMIVLPGCIDAHTHFDMPAGDIKTSDTFYQGTQAALFGGNTTIIDFAECSEDAPLQNGVDCWHKKAAGQSFCDYGFHMTINHWDDTMERQMEEMVQQGINSFKIYTTYTGMKVSDDIIYKVIKKAKALHAMVCVHCENGALIDALVAEKQKENPSLIANHALTRPNIVEKEAISRVIDIAVLAEYKVYIVHLSCKESLEIVQNQRRNGVEVIVESCPHYLLLDDTKYDLDAFESAKYVMSPPLRKIQDCERLWQGLKNDEIQVISTDHCSFNSKGQKDRDLKDFTKICSGIPSVEHRLALLYTYGVKKEKITLSQLARLTSTNPAKAFGLYPNKGSISIGSDADLTIIQDSAPYIISSQTQKQCVDYTPYENVEINMKVQHVFLRGSHIIENGKLKEKTPIGQFIKRR